MAKKKGTKKETAPVKEDVREERILIDKKSLKAAAKDINKADICDPAIDEKGNEDELRAGLLDASEIIEPDDPLKKSTFLILKQLAEEETSSPEEPEESASQIEPPAVEEEEEKPAEEKKPAPSKNKGKKKVDLAMSNKAIIWSTWKNGKGETNINILHKKVNENVKLTTIKNWLSMWAKGKGLPAIAKEI